MLMEQKVYRIGMRVITAVIVILMMVTVCSAGVYAVGVSASNGSFISSYTCDFENNYFSSLNSKNCTFGELTKEDGKQVLKLTITDSSEKGRFVIYNSEKGEFKLKNGNMYAVAVTYKVVQVANSNGSSDATMLNLARLGSDGDTLLKIKSLTNASYKPDDTTDWVTSYAVFKASISGSEQYSNLAINVISPTCPDASTGSKKDQTIILFDEIVVTECNGATNGIEFITNGGNTCSPIMAQSGEQITLPEPTRDLYDFKGWYTDIDTKKQFESNKMPGSMLTKLYAKWAPSDEAIKISFNTNGGGTVATLIGRAGDPVTLPIVKKDGYHFSGWHDKSLNKLQNMTVFPEQSTTVYAKWDALPVVYNFEDSECGKISSKDTRYCNNEVTVEKDEATGNQYLYYKNVGSNSLRLNSPNNGMAVIESGTRYIVTFKYKFATSTKKLVLGANRFVTDPIGSAAYKNVGADISNKIYIHSSSAVADKNGWYTGKFEFSVDDVSDGKTTLAIRNGAVREPESSAVYIDDIIIRRKGVTYKNLVGYDSQGGSFCETDYVQIGDVVTLPKPEREGYRFVGWSYDPEGNQPLESETFTVNSVYTLLYAEWYKLPTEPEHESEPEPQPEPETDSKPTEGDPSENSNTLLYIIMGGAAGIVIIIVVVVILIVKKKKKSKLNYQENKKTDK